MGKAKAIGLILACQMLGISSGSACMRSYDPIPVNLRIDQRQPAVEHRKITRTERNEEERSEAGKHGLTKYKLNFTMSPLYEEKDGRCLYLKQVDLKISLSDFKIIIDSGLKPGSCVYEAVKAHETAQAEVILKNLKAEAEQMQAALQIRLQNLPPESFNAGTKPTAYAKINDVIYSTAQSSVNQIQKKIEDEQLRYDMFKGYPENLKNCGRKKK